MTLEAKGSETATESSQAATATETAVSEATRAEETSSTEQTAEAEAKGFEYNADFIASQQGLTTVSEAELMGLSSDDDSTAASKPKTGDVESESTEKAKETDSATKAKDKTNVDDSKAKGETEETGKATDGKSEDKTEDTSETQKPPKGFVPLAAVKEARSENVKLRQQVQMLQTELSLARTQPDNDTTADTLKDFKVLTDAEFIELSTENPAEALQYTHQLQKYNDAMHQKQLTERYAADRESALNAIYAETNAQMEEALPGIFDKESQAMPELRDFAESIGFSEDMFYLTDPSTQIILPGETTPVVLGEQAASMIKLLVGMRTSLEQAKSGAKVDQEALRAQIEQDVLAKLKTGTAFRSLSALPNETQKISSPESASHMVSEAEFASWPQAKQDAYLRGQ